MSEHKTPGQLLQSLLQQRGWTQLVLAIVLGVDATVISKIVAGKRRLEAPMALALQEVFNVPAADFLELQARYDLELARLVARPNPGQAIRARLYGDLPVAEMVQRGWLDVANVRDVPAVGTALAKFFGVASPEEIEFLPHAAKKTHVTSPTTPAQLAWIYRVRQIASEMLVGRYSPAAVQSAIPKLSNLLSAPSEVRKVPRILAECGIRFVIVETLEGAKIDGVCFWLNDFSPVIGMSLRFDRIDNFWFVLRHECEHVIQRHGHSGIMLDVDLMGERAGTSDTVQEEERVANAAAADFCVPRQKLARFVAAKAPYFNDMIGFAKTIGVHPGIVAGQLQHQTGRYNLFRDQLVKIRSAVAPGAVVDGWGDIAPVGI